ncbi:MAG TPA: ATP-binding protein [Chloroflexi bacterium]|nr:ATP-binding protein [Chloroflexota bacterium]HHW85556.1 ATP-binding protein [Chloroflexota bacterium]
MATIVSKTIVLPTELDRLIELESIVAEMLAHVPDLPEREIVQYNVVLALHELCVNIIKHAYAGEKRQFSVVFDLMYDPTRIQIDTYDNGGRFNLDAWQSPNLDDPPIHGLGIYLMRQLMDEVSYESLPTGNHWRLVKLLS